MQNKPFGPCTKEETKTNLVTIAPLRVIGAPRTFPKGQTSPLIITTKAHQGTHRIATILNTTHRMHHNGCKIWLSQWTSAAQGPPIVDKEGEVLEEDEANTANITTNPPTASRITP